ncbi:hypothetical protein U1Q18_029002 [Sarracenia purpurea var. burkii]
MNTELSRPHARQQFFLMLGNSSSSCSETTVQINDSLSPMLDDDTLSSVSPYQARARRRNTSELNISQFRHHVLRSSSTAAYLRAQNLSEFRISQIPPSCIELKLGGKASQMSGKRLSVEFGMDCSASSSAQ